MQTLNEVISSHPLWRIQRNERTARINKTFHNILSDSTHPWALSLYKFTTVRPLIYFRNSSIHTLLDFFSNNPQLAIQAVRELGPELSHAIFSMLRQGRSWEKEEVLKLQEPQHILDFEQIWHPEYQRYCEHVFNHLIRIPLFILGALNSSDYQQPPLANRVEVLRNNGLNEITIGYDSTTRNAISHGTMTYELNQIVYRDRQRQAQRMPNDFAKLLDGLVDTCHSIVISIMAFIINHSEDIDVSGRYNLPLGIKYLLLDGLVSYGNFKIASMVESQIAPNRKQLNIICDIKSRSRLVQLFEGISTSWQMMLLGGADIDRLSLTFQCGKGVSPTLFINAVRLRQAIIQNETLNDCSQELIETSMLWFDSPAFTRKIYNWSSILPPLWAVTQQQIIENWENLGIHINLHRYSIRAIRNKSAGNVRRIEVHAVIQHKDGINKTTITDTIRHIIRDRRLIPIQGVNINGQDGLPLPPDYIWVRLYAEEKRIRSLETATWSDSNLLARAEWVSKNSKIGPVYIRNPQSIINDIRYEFNPHSPYP